MLFDFQETTLTVKSRVISTLLGITQCPKTPETNTRTPKVKTHREHRGPGDEQKTALGGLRGKVCVGGVHLSAEVGGFKSKLFKKQEE